MRTAEPGQDPNEGHDLVPAARFGGEVDRDLRGARAGDIPGAAVPCDGDREQAGPREESGQQLRAADREVEGVRSAARKPARPKRGQAAEKAGEESSRRSAPARREEGVEEAKKTLGSSAWRRADRSSSPTRDAGTGAETAASDRSSGETGWGRRRRGAEAGGGCGAEAGRRRQAAAAARRRGGGARRQAAAAARRLLRGGRRAECSVGLRKKNLGLGLGMARAILGHNRSSAPVDELLQACSSGGGCGLPLLSSPLSAWRTPGERCICIHGLFSNKLSLLSW